MNEDVGRTSLWTKDFVLVFVSNMLLFFSFYMLIPVLPYYVMDYLGISQTLAGIVLALYTISALLIRPLSGYLVDTFNRKPLYLVCYAVFCAALAGYVVATSLLVFILLRIMHGFAFGAGTVSGSTVAVDIMPSARRGEGIGYYGMAASIAMAVGPAIGYWLYQHHSFSVIFVVALLSGLVGLMAITRIKPIKKPRPADKPQEILSWDRFVLVNALPMVALLFLIGIGYGILTNYLALFCDQKGFEGKAGWFFMALSVGIIIARFLSAKNLNKGKNIQVVYVGSILLGVGFCMFLAADSVFVLYAIALMIGAGLGHINPAFQGMIVHLAQPYQRGTANATYFTFWDLGVGLGIAMGGYVIERLGFLGTFGLCAVLIAFGMVYFMIVSAPYFRKQVGSAVATH
ncbi:MAG: MFS transporter [Breznakibacter sp.]